LLHLSAASADIPRRFDAGFGLLLHLSAASADIPRRFDGGLELRFSSLWIIPSLRRIEEIWDGLEESPPLNPLRLLFSISSIFSLVFLINIDLEFALTKY
jgi:hypothetical protein